MHDTIKRQVAQSVANPTMGGLARGISTEQTRSVVNIRINLSKQEMDKLLSIIAAMF